MTTAGWLAVLTHVTGLVVGWTLRVFYDHLRRTRR